MDTMGQAFQAVIDHLISKGVFKRDTEAAKHLKIRTHHLQEMLKDQRPITLNVITQLVQDYGIDANFLLSAGKIGSMLRKVDIEQMAKAAAEAHSEAEEKMKTELQHLKKELSSKEKIISLLETNLNLLDEKKKSSARVG